MNFSLSQKLKLSMIVLTITAFLVPSLMQAAPSTLVIDEFMVSGKTPSDEYLVVANYGKSPVPLGTYKIVKYSASGKTSATLYNTFGSFVLQPGNRVMICSEPYTGSRLPNTFSYPYSSARTISDNNSILLINGESVVDTVGYGINTATDAPVMYYEGEAIEVGPRANEVLARTNGIDSDNNNFDFSPLVAPVSIDPNVGRLVISELLPSPSSGEEWFELYNPTSLRISLANLKICDALGSRHCYYFDPADYLNGGAYKTYGQGMTKITLNNSGDWLELYDVNDNFLTDSGGDYGDADKGISLSVFGTTYLWTKAPSPAGANTYVDTVEVEEESAVAPKSKKTKSKVVVKTKKVSATKASASDSVETEDIEDEAAVKAAESENPETSTQGVVIGKKALGWGLIGLAILLVLGYTLWYFRDYAKNIYHKIRPRDDSARF